MWSSTCVWGEREQVLCVFLSVKDHHELLHSSPRLKNTCVRQVVSDKWFPVKIADVYFNAEVTICNILQALVFTYFTDAGMRADCDSPCVRQVVLDKWC